MKMHDRQVSEETVAPVFSAKEKLNQLHEYLRGETKYFLISSMAGHSNVQDTHVSYFPEKWLMFKLGSFAPNVVSI